MSSWFKKKRKLGPRKLDSDDTRYAGKPQLVLLENWILDVMGELPQEKQDKTKRIIQRVYGGGEDWKETLRYALRLDSDVEDKFRKLWHKNMDAAHQDKVALNPAAFVKTIVDENFIDHI